MGEYTIVPEFRYFKTFPFLVICCQLVAIGLAFLGYFVTSIAFFLAFLFLLSSFYYLGLSLCNRYYRLKITSDNITVWNIFNKPKQYHPSKLRWKIRRIPWYNDYFILLYSSERVPIAIMKSHWKNALGIMRFPHFGILTDVEREYINFLKKVGLLI